MISKMKRIHNTTNANLVVKDKYSYPRPLSVFKPEGIWYGIDLSWVEWCQENMPSWVHKYFYELTIDLSNIIVISNLEELNRFSKRFVLKDSPAFLKDFSIDWKAVSNDFYGIEINPYLWEARLERPYLWYYGWDVSGGCIWNTKAIIDVKKYLE